MKGSIKILAMLSLFLFACGQVKEKEVKLEKLPPGETNASYSSSTATTSDDETEEEETTSDTASLTPLQKVMAAIEAKRSDTSCYTASNTNSSGCAFPEQVQVVDAIVVGARNCSTRTGGKCSGKSGMDWIVVQEIDGGAMLLNPFGWTTSTTSDINVGDKISFTPSKMRFFYGRGYVYTIDETTLTKSTATSAEMFKLAQQVLDLGAYDFSLKESDNFFKFASGSFKVASTGQTFGTDSRKYFALQTKKHTATTGFYLRTNNSTLLTNGKCYEAKNLFVFWNTTPSTATNIIDLDSFEVTNTSYGLGSITEGDCTELGI